MATLQYKSFIFFCIQSTHIKDLFQFLIFVTMLKNAVCVQYAVHKAGLHSSRDVSGFRLYLGV